MRDAAASVLVCAVEGTALTDAEKFFYKKVAPSGVTLFARNISTNYHETIDLVEELQSLKPEGEPPLVIAIDQEGGRVRRVKDPHFPNNGPAMHLSDGGISDEALASISNYAVAVGQALINLGINVNFAPVLDILTEPANTAIGDRAFGTDVDPVCRRAGAFLKAMQTTGVLGCLKHFPGQGDAQVDTHVGKAIVDLPLKTLYDRELVPFRALLDHSAMVMVSHCIYPQLAHEEASRSPKVIGGLLRGEMGFEGVVVSDDMNMGALPQDRGPWLQSIIEAVAAGIDMVLVCRDLDKCQAAYDALTAAAAKSASFDRRLRDAASRVMKLRSQLISV